MAPQPGSCLCTAAVTFNGVLNLACSLNLSVLDEERAARLAQRVYDNLVATLKVD